MFIGYCENHKGYVCISPQGRVYISRHVIFYHHDFPYKSFLNSYYINPSAANTSQPPILVQGTSTRPSTSPIAVEQSSSPDRYDQNLSYSPINHTKSDYLSSSPLQSPQSTYSSSTKYALPDTMSSPSPLSTTSSSTIYALPPARTSYLPDTTINLHPMTTRSKADITKPNPQFIRSVTTTELPNSVTAAIQNSI